MPAHVTVKQPVPRIVRGQPDQSVAGIRHRHGVFQHLGHVRPVTYTGCHLFHTFVSEVEDGGDLVLQAHRDPDPVLDDDAVLVDLYPFTVCRGVIVVHSLPVIPNLPCFRLIVCHLLLVWWPMMSL